MINFCFVKEGEKILLHFSFIIFRFCIFLPACKMSIIAGGHHVTLPFARAQSIAPLRQSHVAAHGHPRHMTRLCDGIRACLRSWLGCAPTRSSWHLLSFVQKILAANYAVLCVYGGFSFFVHHY